MCSCSKFNSTHEYDSIIEKLTNRFLTDEFRPDKYAFVCRKSNNKDATNGVIGQAWIIEALVEAYRCIDNKNYLSLAEELFLMHKFDKKSNMWHCIGIDGKTGCLDMTFNHQLWFAASGAMVFYNTNNKDILHMISRFLDAVPRLMIQYHNGLIGHKTRYYSNCIELSKGLLKHFLEYISRIIGFPCMKYKEIGYHAFNLYGFALLYNNFQEHKFFSNKLFCKALEYCNKPEYMQNLINMDAKKDINSKNMPKYSLYINRYGYPYNPIGFELAFISEVFSDRRLIEKDVVEKSIATQTELTYDSKKCLFCRNTEDPKILNMRFYEYARILLINKK